MVHSIK